MAFNISSGLLERAQFANCIEQGSFIAHRFDLRTGHFDPTMGHKFRQSVVTDPYLLFAEFDSTTRRTIKALILLEIQSFNDRHFVFVAKDPISGRANLIPIPSKCAVGYSTALDIIAR